MPVRIYDIAKKLGIESKEVLARAKELGITGAKVPSSSLDKITAEYLEDQLGGAKPPVVAAPPPAHEPVVIVSAPPEPPPPTVPVEITTMPATESVTLEASSPAPETIADVVEAAAAPPPPVAPLEPPAPPKPGIGEKVGFIQLPQKPAPRIGVKAGPVKQPVPAPARPMRPGDRPAVGPQPQRPAAKTPGLPAPPLAPKFVPPV